MFDITLETYCDTFLKSVIYWSTLPRNTYSFSFLYLSKFYFFDNTFLQ